jgi:hypothetical protein
MITLASGAGLFCCTLGLLLADSAPRFDINPVKKDDSVTAARDGKTFTIKVKSGIGGVSIQLAKGKWPKRNVVRIEYANGKPFKSLESFKLTTEKFRIEGSLKESGKMSYFEKNADAGFKRKGTRKVVAREKDNGIDVILPAGMLTGAKKVEIQWVDFYR